MWSFIGFVGFVVGIIALIKGKMPRLKIHNRKVAAIVLAISFIVMVAGATGSPDETPGKSVAEPGEAIEDIKEDEKEIHKYRTETESESESEPPGEPSTDPVSSTPSTTTPSGQLKAHFIDVGQGDAILIEMPGFTALIDGGPRSAGQTVSNYIKELGIKSIDLVIATHPHEDHVGGLINILKEFPVKEVIDPAIIHTTKTFEEYLTIIDEKDIKFTEGRAGLTRDLGGAATLQILHPGSPSSSDLNNASIVTRISFGETSFLLAGDAESTAENEIIGRGYDLGSTILKVGHHGSKTSTTQPFLTAVGPEAAVVMCGEGNSYGHPHEETLTKLSAAGVDIYRTDEHGTIIITTDGKTHSVNKTPFSYHQQPQPPPQEPTQSDPEPTEQTAQGTYVSSIKSDKYHKPTCRHAKNILPGNEIWFNTVDDAKAAGYKPCGVCKPPQ